MNIQRSLPLAKVLLGTFHRHLGMASVAGHKQMDPVQKLFLDQVMKYAESSKKQGGGPVDAGPSYKKLKEETETRLKTVYGVTDPKAFPEMKFTEPDLDQDTIEELRS